MPSVSPIHRGRWVCTFLAALILLLILAACRPSISPSDPTHPPAGTAAGSPAAATPTTAHEPTPLPPIPAAVLVLPGSIEPSLAANLRAVVSELAASSGLEFSEAASFPTSGQGLAVKMVVAVADPAAGLDPAYAAAVEALPETQFIFLDLWGNLEALQAGGNISRIGPAGEAQAFLAGYAAALSSHDWRVGMLSRGDSPQAVARRDAFINGVRYMCGVCNPKYPPYVKYPVYADALSAADWAAGVESLAQQEVKTLYIDPSLQTEELLAFVFGKGMTLVGGVSPIFAAEEITPETSGRWILTVGQDPLEALRSIWGEVAAGNGGKSWPSSLALQDRNPALLSSARLRLVEETLQALAEGWISPASVPVE